MQLTYSPSPSQTIEILLPSSKSISNRVLIINELCKNKAQLHRLSSARDTQTMQTLLHSEEDIWDVQDAGTVCRFLTAFLAISGKQKTLTGTDRMKQRPIGELVEALKLLGAKIQYLENEGFLPLNIEGVRFQQLTNEISIRGDISSQFVSALLMIAPILPQGLKLSLTGKLSSLPYIEMTLQLMQIFGIQYNRLDEKTFEIPHQSYYAPQNYTVESDWSAASYAYSIVALAENLTISLPYLYQNSLQGDSKIAEWMQLLGVKTTFLADKIVMGYDKNLQKKEPISIDFTQQPDLAQTLVVIAAAKNIPLILRGLHSLRIKETDRILALQTELKKLGVALEEIDKDVFSLSGKFTPSHQSIATYDDHRMAMAFAPLVFVQGKIDIENEAVVAKSYPHFWQDLEKCGCLLKKML